MSTALIIVGIFITLITTSLEVRNHNNRKEAFIMTMLTTLFMVSFLSVFFYFSNGRTTVLIGGISLILGIILYLITKLYLKLTYNLQGVFTLFYNTGINVILVIVPFILLVRNYSHLNPIILILISFVLSTLLIIGSIKIGFEFYKTSYSYFLIIIVIVIGVYLFNFIRYEINHQEIQNLDNLFAKDITYENIFDIESLNIELSSSEELWINDVKVIKNKIFFI